MKWKFLFFIGFAFLFCTCKKEPFYFYKRSIEQLSAHPQFEIRKLTKLRLAFAKTVANALEHPDFRNYIKEQSQTNRYRGFKEIVFGMHQEDLVSGNQTLRQVLESAIDVEVDSLFEENLFDLLFEIDPMVTLKIPDIFFDFEWNTTDVVPMVYVRTPIGLAGDDFEDMAFHASGFQERYQRFELPKHFCIIIKYSEDFLSYNATTFKNEKSLSIFEFVPQLRTCWTAIEPSLPLIGTPVPQRSELIYINKLSLYQLYQSTCQTSIEPISDCSENCLRDCAPLAQVKTVFRQIETSPYKRFRGGDASFIFRENYHFVLSLETLDQSFTAEYGLLGLRKTQFFENKFGFTFENKEAFYDNLGTFKIPTMVIDFDPQTANRITTDFDLLLFEGWPENKQNEPLRFYLDEVIYEDLVTSVNIAPFDVNDVIPGRINIRPTQAIHHRGTEINFCDEKDFIYNLGGFKLNISY